MSVLSREDLIKKVTEFLGETPTDEGVSLLEDVTDTLNSTDDSGTEWKQKYEENDKMWRKKYIDRFNGKTDPEDDPNKDDPEDNNKNLTFDSLFKGDK